MSEGANRLLRQLPSVGEVLEQAEVARLMEMYSRERVTGAARSILKSMRDRVLSGDLDEAGLAASVNDAGRTITCALQAQAGPRLQRVVNATGVILQTNLGRAPLSEAAIHRIVAVARGYCNVEFDLEHGKRSRRDDLVEDLILAVAGSEAKERRGAAVVNNCAAATFLALNTLADGGEVIVSRGELVEIGGGFRVPEILAKSGAQLREVGTTNKTRVSDYAAAIGPGTRLILRVHRSNFEIRGFTEQPSLDELIGLGRDRGVPVFEDQGTGCVVDLASVRLPGESSWVRSVRSGAALVAASGDKLLGGPQCGLLVGDREIVERIRANPLFRALRVDKLTYAALEATLQAYLLGREGELPVIAMLRLPAEAVRVRCERWAEALRLPGVEAVVVATQSVVGGGTTPGASLPSFAVAVQCAGLSEGVLSAMLRGLEPAIVARVSEGRVLLDLRTVREDEDAEALSVLQAALCGDKPARAL